jgi:LPS export ABC transporter permease LptF
MRILDRYIGRQILTGTLTGVLLLTGVFVLGNLFKQLDKILGQAELPLSIIGKFVLYVMPGSLVYTIPWAFLTAILLTFGRLSADNELISMRMGGLSMMRICLPVFVLAAALCGFCYWANVSLSPMAQTEIKNMFYKEASRDPALLFQAGRVVDKMPGLLIYTDQRNDREMSHLYIYQKPTKEKKEGSVMIAQKGRVDLAEDKRHIALELEGDVLFYQSNPDMGKKVSFQPLRATKWTYQIPLEDLIAKATEEKTGMKNNAEISAELASGIRANTGEVLTPQRRSEYLTEIHKRWNFSFGCLTFAFIGIPLAITAQRRETSIGFAVSMVTAVVYFFFFILADGQRTNPSVYPHLLMWLPNVIFLTIGIILFVRLSRK